MMASSKNIRDMKNETNNKTAKTKTGTMKKKMNIYVSDIPTEIDR